MTIGAATVLCWACSDEGETGSDTTPSEDAGASSDARPSGADGGGGGGDGSADSGPVIPPGSPGAACDRKASDCNEGLACRYDLDKGYLCQPATDACVQPKESTALNVGFIYGNWTLPASEEYADVTLDMHPVKTGADDAPLQFFAFGGTFLHGATPGDGFYGGLQTKIGNATPAGGKRGVIFSGFGVTDAIPAAGSYVAIDTENCDGTPGAVCAQLSTPYDWHDGGTYRLRYRFVGDAPSGPAHRLLRVSVTDVDAGKETVLGDLVTPAAWRLPASYYTFDETFPDNPEICDTYNPSDIFYTRLRADGVAGTVKHSDDNYPGPCKSFFHYRAVDDGYRLLLGICVP